MKVLVGIPIFRIPELLRDCLNSMIDTPATVLVVDNAADQNVKDLIEKEFAGRVIVLTNETNQYCNGGWNRVMEYGLQNGYDIIGLGSSDANLHPGWYENLIEHAKCPHEVWVPAMGQSWSEAPKECVTTTEGLAGYLTFLPREAAALVYPIPESIRHWFGDQYMFEKLRANGWKTVVLNDVRAMHFQSSVTYVTPEAYGVIEQDKLAWAAMGGR